MLGQFSGFGFSADLADFKDRIVQSFGDPGDGDLVIFQDSVLVKGHLARSLFLTLAGHRLSLLKSGWQGLGEILSFPGFGHGIDVIGADDVHAGVGEGVELLTIDNVIVDHLGGVIAPAPILLPDQAIQQPFLEVLQLHRQGVEGNGLHAGLSRFFPEGH